MATAQIDQGLVELLQPVASGDIFAGIAPQDQRSPFVIYQRISGQKIRAINGPSGLSQTSFQIDAYSSSYTESRQLADQIRKILDGFRGTVTIGADSVRIGGVSMTEERDFIEDDPEPILYRASVDYLFTYDEDL